MKMNLKRLSLLLISGAVLFSFCGCTSVKCMVAKGKLRKYMKETYPDDSFTWEEGWGDSNEYITFYKMTGHSKKFPDAEIHASCSRYNQYDDDWSFSSTYPYYLYRQDVEAYIHDIAERVFGACKVYEIPNPRGLEEWDNLSQTNESIVDYIKEIRIYVEIFLPPDGLSKEEAADGIKQLETLLGEKGMYKVKGNVRIITDQEIYDNTVSNDVPISGGVKNVLVVTVGELNSLNAKCDKSTIELSYRDKQQTGTAPSQAASGLSVSPLQSPPCSSSFSAQQQVRFLKELQSTHSLTLGSASCVPICT